MPNGMPSAVRPVKLRMQQRVELIAVAGGEGGVECAGESGRGDFVHPDDPPSEFVVLAAQ
jgi:hypothetical protein